MSTTFNPQPGQHWITTTSGMSGHFAVEVWLNNEDEAFTFPEPYETGIGRYRTKEEAQAEAIAWAEAEGLTYVP